MSCPGAVRGVQASPPLRTLALRALPLTLLGLLAIVATLAAAQGAIASTSIASSGPLDHISIGVDQACQVHYEGDEEDAFYPGPAVRPGDCGTFILVDGILYGPHLGQHDASGAVSSFPAMLALVPVSQGVVTGSGTAADPFSLVTVVDAGSLRIAQTDLYVVGTQVYDTVYTITRIGTNGPAGPVTLYHAGDCHMQAPGHPMDHMWGWVPADGIACSYYANNSPPGRFLSFRSELPHRYMEDEFDVVWDRIAAGLPLTNTCTCNNVEDNGIAISWSGTVPVDVPWTVAMRTAFGQGPPLPHDPVADFTVDASLAECTDSAVRFQNTSTDVDGDIVSYAWSFGDGTTSVQTDPRHTYEDAGTYLVSLTVTDATGRTGVKSSAVYGPGDPNCAPCLVSIPERTLREGELVRFFAVADDFEDDRLEFTMTGQPPAAVFDVGAGYFSWRPTAGSQGTYALTVTVADGLPHTAAAAPDCVQQLSSTIVILPGLAYGAALDQDRDGIDDGADNCPGVPNQAQHDSDRDNIGDACQEIPVLPPGDLAALGRPGTLDSDLDQVEDARDNCPGIANSLQADKDLDRIGDVCDADLDGDGVPQVARPGSFLDNCPLVANADQADLGVTGVGDACRPPALAAPRADAAAPAANGDPAATYPAGAGLLVQAAIAIAFLAGMAAVALVLAVTRRGRGGGR